MAEHQNHVLTGDELYRFNAADHRRASWFPVVFTTKSPNHCGTTYAGNHSRISQLAMTLLAGAQIPLRTVSVFPITHDKFFVVDGRMVETGSLNFTRSGERYNSENVIVLKDMPDVAQRYLTHWQSRWDLGADWFPAQ